MSDRETRCRSVEEAIALVGLAPRSSDTIVISAGACGSASASRSPWFTVQPCCSWTSRRVGLDPDVRAVFWERFRRMAESGTTIMVSSHTMDDATHCDRLAFLRDGKVIALDTPSALRAATGRPDASLEDAFIHFLRRTDG